MSLAGTQNQETPRVSDDVVAAEQQQMPSSSSDAQTPVSLPSSSSENSFMKAARRLSSQFIRTPSGRISLGTLGWGAGSLVVNASQIPVNPVNVAGTFVTSALLTGVIEGGAQGIQYARDHFSLDAAQNAFRSARQASIDAFNGLKRMVSRKHNRHGDSVVTVESVGAVVLSSELAADLSPSTSTSVPSDLESPLMDNLSEFLLPGAEEQLAAAQAAAQQYQHDVSNVTMLAPAFEAHQEQGDSNKKQRTADGVAVVTENQEFDVESLLQDDADTSSTPTLS